MNEWLEVCLEEYKTLRAESMSAMSAQQSILNYGFATTAALIAVGFHNWTGQVGITIVVFLGFLPIVSSLVLIIWLGEVARMMRASVRLITLEEKINSFLDKPDPALTWETWLRQKDDGNHTPQLKWNYAAIVFAFMLISLFSIVIGIFSAHTHLNPLGLVIVYIWELLILLSTCVFVIQTARNFK